MAFLVLDPLVEARLKALLTTPNIKVLSLADYSQIEDRSQFVPCVFCIPQPFEPQIDENGLVQIVDRFLTIVCVRNAGSMVSGQDARTEAGPIMDETFNALLGWQPAGYRPIVPTKPPAHAYRNGLGYFPLAWRAPRKKFPMPCPGNS